MAVNTPKGRLVTGKGPDQRMKSNNPAVVRGNKLAAGNRGPRIKLDMRRNQRMISNEIDRLLQRAYKDKNGVRLGTTATRIAKRLLDIALNGADKDSIKAITELINRLEGKPMQAIEHSMNPDKPLEMVHRTMSPAEAARRYQALLRDK